MRLATLAELDLADLAQSMAVSGLQERIKVYVQSVAAGGQRVVSSGHRRLFVAQALGWATIPAIVEPAPATTGPAQAVARIASNLCRKDIDPISLARGIQALLEQHPNLTQTVVGTMLGKSQSSIANSLRLLHLPAEVVHFIETGQLTAEHGRVLLSIEADELSYSGPTGRTAAAVQREKAEFAVKAKSSAADLRTSVKQWEENQKYYRAEATKEAARAAQRAAQVAAGKDPEAEARASQQAAWKEQQERQVREAAERAERRIVARDTIRAALAEPGVDWLRMVACVIFRDRNIPESEGVFQQVLDARTSDDLLDILHRYADYLLSLEYEGHAISTYGTGAQFALRTWDLNTRIAHALLAHKLVGKQEHKNLVAAAAKSRPAPLAPTPPAESAPAAASAPAPRTAPACPGCQTLLVAIAGSTILACPQTATGGGCGCFWTADTLEPVAIADGYAAVDAATPGPAAEVSRTAAAA
jgi:ParB/RepB/Spo0J family partition protein